jgi:hypothetical protein
LLWGSAAVAAVAAAGLAVAHADNLLNLRPAKPTEPAVYRSTNTPEQDRLLAKAAFTEVLAHKNSTLGMKAPVNLQPYAPVFPDGLILEEIEAPDSATGGSIQYAAAGSLRTVLDFYEDAAALHHLPFRVSAEGPDTLVFSASDGRRKVEARLTRQFANGTDVVLTYR